MMKKITLSLALTGMTALSALAQQNAKLVTVNPSTADAAASTYTAKQIGTPNQTQALFDIQFNYNATDTTGRTGMAGVAFTGTEFWVSRWQSDTIFTFSPGGAVTDTFTIPGITGIRCFTWDGTNIYAGLNTNSIRIINPVTKMQTGTINAAAAAVTGVRHMTYDSTANSGAGGFWIGNFGTNIVLISMTGAVLQTIPAATHGLTAMYGSAIDHWTAGGPYLWVFDQGGASQSRLVRLQLPSGTPTGLTHDVMADVGVQRGLTSGLAGGLFITNGLGATRTIVGLIQGTPDNLLFGYELNDFVQPAVDAQLDSLTPNSPYILRPITHFSSPLNWNGVISNQGTATLTATDFVVNVMSGASTVYTNTTTVNNLTTLSTANPTTSAAFTPSATGNFTVKAYASVVAPQVDLVHSNDTIDYNFGVTDTVFAREDGISSGSLGIGNGSGGTLGQTFTTSTADQITSVTMQFTAPTAGDSMRATIHSFGATPGAVLASTPYYKFVPADTLGMVLTLPLTGGPLPIAAGTYFVGVNEVASNVTLATTDFNFRPNSSWVIFGANPWTPAENFGFSKTFLLRMNVAGEPVGLKTNAFESQDLLTYPNPASTHITVELEKNTNSVSILNVLGEEVYNTAVNATAKKLSVDLTAFPSGIYFVKATANGKVRSSKIVVSK
ncbi:MAG: hypothetical protein K0S33_3775 [Bacteroidetes bacterium]|jgi:hypothetical protein|nr:hypothetical protein [Bacteroidota bacterium]